MNQQRIPQPPATPLSDVGRRQASAVARELAKLRPAALISSDLLRAMQTAEAIAGECGLTIEPDERLRERDFGELRGQPYDSLGFDPLRMSAAPPGGESGAAFARRAGVAFMALRRRRAEVEGPPVVVTHGLLIRTLLAGPIGLAPDRLDEVHLGNTAVTIVAAAPPFEVEQLASLSHLDPDWRENRRSLVGG